MKLLKVSLIAAIGSASLVKCARPERRDKTFVTPNAEKPAPPADASKKPADPKAPPVTPVGTPSNDKGTAAALFNDRIPDLYRAQAAKEFAGYKTPYFLITPSLKMIRLYVGPNGLTKAEDQQLVVKNNTILDRQTGILRFKDSSEYIGAKLTGPEITKLSPELHHMLQAVEAMEKLNQLLSKDGLSASIKELEGPLDISDRQVAVARELLKDPTAVSAFLKSRGSMSLKGFGLSSTRSTVNAWIEDGIVYFGPQLHMGAEEVLKQIQFNTLPLE